MSERVVIFRDDAGEENSARWRSESGVAPPRKVVVVDDRITADAAYRLACEGTAMLWRGDFHNARQLLQAMGRRIGRVSARRKRPTGKPAHGHGAASDAFNQHRLAQSQRARILGSLLIPFDEDYRVALRRAPDVGVACRETWGSPDGPFVLSLRELLGVIGAHEWRRKGVDIGALGARIHPHYGVFSPIRGEYIDLVASAPMPSSTLAFDIGTGTGVLAAVLARRGVARVVATDQDERALACATENITRLGFGDRVEIMRADLFPPGRAALVVCNPPWLPARPTSALEHAVYDPESRMLRGFLAGLADHLAAHGEGWLILSDLAEHLGLRSRAELLALISGAGLSVIERHDTRPNHARVSDASDALHAARAAEVTSLWRLAVA